MRALPTALAPPTSTPSAVACIHRYSTLRDTRGKVIEKMRVPVVCLFSLLLTCANAGLLYFPRFQHARQPPTPGPALCTSLPLPSLDTETMLSKLQPYLAQVDQKVQDALKEDNSSGGAVLSVVYRNKTIWTKGYGLINMSGQSLIYMSRKFAVHEATEE